MSSARIFLVGEDKEKLTPMIETVYAKEHVLQNYLAQYPDLLPGDQINPENPRRWLLVAREMGVPSDEGENKHWSLDHLFLDQDGIPTFVECKRSSDTRARREVVAQMLDYAANGLEYWSLERLQQDATKTAEAKGGSIDEELNNLLNPQDDSEIEIEAFWKRVEDNLQRGKVRLVFVADETSRELRRLVEFLNEKMADVEVLIVEIKQFLGDGQTALVPRTIGLRDKIKPPTTGPTTQGIFLSKCTDEAKPIFEKLFNMVENKGYKLVWGTAGFSARASLPNSVKHLSFAYGFAKHQFKLHVKNLGESASGQRSLRDKFRELGFADGKNSVKIALEEKTASAAIEALKLALDRVAELIEADQASQ